MKERGHSCPPVLSTIRQADRNVRAPSGASCIRPEEHTRPRGFLLNRLENEWGGALLGGRIRFGHGAVVAARSIFGIRIHEMDGAVGNGGDANRGPVEQVARVL